MYSFVTSEAPIIPAANAVNGFATIAEAKPLTAAPANVTSAINPKGSYNNPPILSISDANFFAPPYISSKDLIIESDSCVIVFDIE